MNQHLILEILITIFLIISVILIPILYLGKRKTGKGLCVIGDIALCTIFLFTNMWSAAIFFGISGIAWMVLL